MESQQIGESSTASGRPENVKICTIMEMIGEEIRNATLKDNDGLEMDLRKVCKEEIPYHARIYGRYFSKMAMNIGGKFVLVDVGEVMSEITDKQIAKISRAYNMDKECEISENEIFKGEILDHRLYGYLVNEMEVLIDDQNSGIKNFKIFYIRDIISHDTKPNAFSWSAKFQSVENKIELEIDSSHEENGNGTSQTKIVDFIIDPLDCDKPLTASFDDLKVEYILFSNAFRVEFEIRPYTDDGKPVRSVSGYVLAKLMYAGGVEYEEYLFGGKEYEKSECTSESDNRIKCPAFILSRDIRYFKLEVSFSDNTGTLLVNDDVFLNIRSVATDEQHYIMGKHGYIILTAFWFCLCVCMGKGVCTCPGSAIGTFAAENTDSDEDTEADELLNYARASLLPTFCSDEEGDSSSHETSSSERTKEDESINCTAACPITITCNEDDIIDGDTATGDFWAENTDSGEDAKDESHQLHNFH